MNTGNWAAVSPFLVTLWLFHDLEQGEDLLLPVPGNIYVTVRRVQH